MISFKTTIVIMCIVLTVLLITRKARGLGGTWDKRNEIQEYAILNSIDGEGTDDDKKKKNQNNNSTQISSSSNGGKESKGEKICRKHLEKRMSTKFNKERPDFLKNPITNNNLELDCYSPELKLALEYNGKQHYEFSPIFHKTKTDFYNQKYRDEIKKRLCYENGIDLIEVPYSVTHERIPFYIDSALQKLGRVKFL